MENWGFQTHRGMRMDAERLLPCGPLQDHRGAGRMPVPQPVQVSPPSKAPASMVIPKDAHPTW